MLRRMISRPAGVPPSIRQLLTASVVSASAAMAMLPAPASAQFFFFNDYDKPVYRPRAPVYRLAPAEPRQPPRRVRRFDQAAPSSPAPVTSGRKAIKKDESVAEVSQVPLYAVVSLEDQHVSVYGADGLIERADVSTGTQDHPTPTGVFAIIQKERWHESNIYSGASMPFMQRVTWSGIAMHTGQLPGYPASHGCIRLHNEFAERWFGMTKLGLRVLISPAEITPEPVAHPHLPSPRYRALPGVEAQRKPVQAADLSGDALVQYAAPLNDAVVNPVAYAIIEKAKAKSQLRSAEKAEGDASDAVESAARILKDAVSASKTAEREFLAAEDRLGWFGLIGNRRPPPLNAKFGDGIMKAIADYEAANRRLSDTRRTEAGAKSALAAANVASRKADARTEELKARIVDMGRRQETVSVFISLKDERLYVRQALRPVFDVPIEIRNPGTPIGTHVFMAAPPAEGRTGLRWTALSLPVDQVPKPARIAKLRRASMIETGSIGEAIPAENATGALSRIQIPGEVLDLISERVWTGASVIISDRGITHETGTGTDFIVETKH